MSSLLPAANKKGFLYLGLVLLTGLNLFNYMDRYVLASVVPPLKTELQLSDTEIGWLSSAFMIGYFAAAPLFGYLGDRGRRKALIMSGAVLWSLGTILSGLCYQYWTLLACRILVGVGEASYAVLAPAWLSDLFPAERRNKVLSIFYAATPVGSALGYAVGGAALAHGGWRVGFLWAGAPALLLALAFAALTEPARAGPAKAAWDGPAASSRGPGLSGILSLFRIGDYIHILLGLTAYTFALGAFAAWGPTFLNRVHGLELSVADHFFGAALVAGGLSGTLIGGFVATVWQRKARAGYAMLLTLAASMTALFGTAAFLNGGTTASMACLAAAIFVSFLPTAPIVTLLIGSVPGTLRASAMAVSIFVIHLFGDFWSPVLVGRLADWGYRPSEPGFGLQHAMLVLPAALVFSALAWGRLAWRQRNRPVKAYTGELGDTAGQ